MNYTALKQAIIDYCSNTESSFVTNIPTFVQQAEQRVFNTVQFPSLRKNVVGNTTASNKYLACPTDFLAAYSVAVIDGTGAYSFTVANNGQHFVRVINSAGVNPTLAGSSLALTAV